MTTTALYARLSLDRNGTGVSVDRQLADCRDLAARRGWEVVAEHRDDSRSAWKRDRKRPGWDALLTAIDSGDVESVVVWHGDRLARQPRDLEELIRLVEQRGLLVASPGGTRDLGNADDRFIVRVETAAACRESDSTSRRVRRVKEEAARQGRWAGPTPYGWRAEGEADVVRRIVHGLLAGDSLRHLTATLNDEGIPAPRGGQWRIQQVRQVALRWANAGLREHHGEVVGPGTWEALVTPEQQERLARLFADPSRSTRPKAVRRHLLTGVLRCAVCGQGVHVKHLARGGAAYTCPDSHVSIQQAGADAFVLALVQARLDRPDARALRTRGPEQEHVDRLVVLRQRLDGLAQDYADGVLDRQQVRVAGDTLRGEIAEVTARLAEYERRSSVLADTGVDLAALPLDRQRAVIAALVRLTVQRAARKGPGFDPYRIGVEWVAGDRG